MTAQRILALSAELATLEANIANVQARGEKVPDYLHVIVRRRKQQLEDLTWIEAANADEAHAVRQHRTPWPLYLLLVVCAVIVAGYVWVLFS